MKRLTVEKIETVAKWLQEQVNEGVQAYELGLFVRSQAQLYHQGGNEKPSWL